MNIEKAASTGDVEGAEKHSSDIVDSEEADIEQSAEKLVEIPTEDFCPNFKCDQCAYTNATERGLSQHVRMKHRISQLDGNSDSEGEDQEKEIVQTLTLDKAIDQDCFTVLGITEKCMISCNQKFS